MVSKTHTMNLGISKNEISRIITTRSAQKQNNIHNLFSVIATKSVEIVFKKKIDNIKEVNRNYVTP